MPVRKLKPIEERDPYAALVLDAYDKITQESIMPDSIKGGPDKLVDDLIESFQKASFDSLDTQKHYQAMRSKVISLLSKVMRSDDDESDEELIEKVEGAVKSVSGKLITIMESMLEQIPEGYEDYKKELVERLNDLKNIPTEAL